MVFRRPCAVMEVKWSPGFSPTAPGLLLLLTTLLARLSDVTRTGEWDCGKNTGNGQGGLWEEQGNGQGGLWEWAGRIVGRTGE